MNTTKISKVDCKVKLQKTVKALIFVKKRLCILYFMFYKDFFY
jgi:hypothetical protein